MPVTRCPAGRARRGFAMAFLHADSFARYATADLTTEYTQIQLGSGSSGGAFAIAAVGRNGTNGLQIKPNTVSTGNNNSSRFRKVLPASGATAIAAFAFRQV